MQNIVSRFHEKSSWFDKKNLLASNWFLNFTPIFFPLSISSHQKSSSN